VVNTLLTHVSDEIFPELKDIGLEDLSEGT
jgi:hypothetical protein